MADALTLGATYSNVPGQARSLPLGARACPPYYWPRSIPILPGAALRFATTTGGQQTSIPPVAPSVATSKHTSARIETYFKGTITDIDNA